MDRRRLLRSAAGLLAGVGLAGCTSADGEVPVTAEPPPPGVGDGSDGSGEPGTATPEALSIEDYTETESEDGTLVVMVTVSNGSDRRQVRLVRVTVTLDGVETVAEKFVALGAGGTETVRLDVDVGYQAFLDGGTYVPEVVDRTPATPTSTATASIPTHTGTADAGGDSPSDDGTDSGWTAGSSRRRSGVTSSRRHPPRDVRERTRRVSRRTPGTASSRRV